MKVLVLGGGVAGVTAAYFIARDGHEVTVVEAADGLGLDATAANAGLISPGHSFAWAKPGAPLMLARSLLDYETSIRMRFRLDPQLYAWGLKFLRECTDERARRNTLIKLRLGRYSQAVMNEIALAERIDYHQSAGRGALYVYRDPAELEAGVKKMALLAEHGQQQEVLDTNAVARLDPVFEPVKHKIAGAVRDLTDSSGDSQMFTEGVARAARDKYGVTVRFNTRVTAIEADGDRVLSVLTTQGPLNADVYVLALGVSAAFVARTIGVKLHVYPVKGYSSTFPIKEGGQAPTIAGLDEQWLVAWSRLGNRLRLTSTADFAGYDRSWVPRDFNNVLRFARDIFPEAADWNRGEYRACLRPMTPDGPPVLGYGRHRNLLFNVGHGHMGWTMACGTGRIAADLLSGRRPELDLDGLGPRRQAGG